MPRLDDPIHLNMYAGYRREHRWPQGLKRILLTIKSEVLGKTPRYGVEWGDVELVPPLKYFRESFLTPYVNPDHVALEIGPGGGRWTQYMLGFKKLYLVDYHQQLLDEIRSSISARNVEFIKNNGCDFPGVCSSSIDFIFSFGVFVHLDIPIIEGYLNNIRGIAKPGATIVLQYADKTKRMAQINAGFSDTDPDRMRLLAASAGYRIVEEDTTTLWHSSVIRLTPR